MADYNKVLLALLVVLVIAIAYSMGWLNTILPSDWQRSTFRGDAGRTKELSNTLYGYDGYVNAGMYA